MSADALGLLLAIGLLGFIAFLICVLIIRWALSINGAIKLLEQIRDELKRLNSVK